MGLTYSVEVSWLHKSEAFGQAGTPGTGRDEAVCPQVEFSVFLSGKAQPCFQSPPTDEPTRILSLRFNRWGLSLHLHNSLHSRT